MQHVKSTSINDHLAKVSQRPVRGSYFSRVCGYDTEVDALIHKYFDAAQKCGTIISGNIPAPTPQNLEYYNEMLGSEFQLDLTFIKTHLKKWIAQLKPEQLETIGTAIYDTLNSMKAKGKPDGVLKSTYTKFMCWLYFQFRGIVGRLGNDDLPKIIYDGNITNHELMFMNMIHKAGCDILLIEYNGDDNYLKLDPNNEISEKLPSPAGSFPSGYSLKKIKEDKIAAAKRPATTANAVNKPAAMQTPAPPTANAASRPTTVRTPAPSTTNPSTHSVPKTPQKVPVPIVKVQACTNAWIKGEKLDDVRTPYTLRGNDDQLFYNVFTRINGEWDKLTYINDLYTTYTELQNAGRHIVVVENEIPIPTPQEINTVDRSQCENSSMMIFNLSKQIRYDFNQQLRDLMAKAFIELMEDEAKDTTTSLGKLTTKAVYLLCWIKRYTPQLFVSWKWNSSEPACFIYLGGCKNSNEALWLRYLSRLPVDVVILVPDLNMRCCLEDETLYEQNFSDSEHITAFPYNQPQIRVGTVAYHAERELDQLMYQDSGMYREHQYAKATVITLNTMYEEIAIFWDQELKFRPGFNTANDTVSVPVIFSKVSGVKDGNTSAYWASVKKLITPETTVLTPANASQFSASDDILRVAPIFFRNGKVDKEKIINHKHFKYGYLREEVIDYMLDKLELLLNGDVIKDTSTNNVTYTIIATVLNLPDEIIRRIQSFDFTKKNPKIVYINTSQTIMTVEESIVMAYLNMIGFDIVFFVPTGYRCVEKYFNGKIVEDHQIGEYLYDLSVPHLGTSSAGKKPFAALKNKLFGK